MVSLYFEVKARFYAENSFIDRSTMRAIGV